MLVYVLHSFYPSLNYHVLMEVFNFCVQVTDKIYTNLYYLCIILDIILEICMKDYSLEFERGLKVLFFFYIAGGTF